MFVGSFGSYGFVDMQWTVLNVYSHYNKLKPTFLCVKFLPEISGVFKHLKHPLVTALGTSPPVYLCKLYIKG